MDTSNLLRIIEAIVAIGLIVAVLLQQKEGGLGNMFGGGSGFSGRTRNVKFRGEDYNAELQLDLLSASKTFKQTLNVNGKNIRITVPAGV